MHDILQIGGCAGDPLQRARRAWECRIGRLRNSNRRVFVHRMRQPESIVRKENAIRVQSQDIIAFWHTEIAFRLRTLDQPEISIAPLFAIAFPHQAYITVKVHGFVGFMREICVAFPLEARDFDLEQRGDTAIFASDSSQILA